MTLIELVQAGDGSTAPPSEIVYIPEGNHSLTPTVNGKPQKIKVIINSKNGEKIAASLQRDLEKRQSGNVRPFFDFDHNITGPASAIPQKISYQEGRGIVATVEWTGKGAEAIQAKDYSYFSPMFLRDPKSGEPAGLPRTGPLGALVNDPAFRDIPRIAASHAGATHKPNIENMSELVACGLLTPDEGARENAPTIAKDRIAAMSGDSDKVKALNEKIAALIKERDEMKGKVEAADAASKATKETHAKSLVSAAVADGRILAKDEATQSFWTHSLVSASDASAEEALKGLKPINEGITQTVTAGNAGDKIKDGDTLAKLGQEKVAAGLAKNQEEGVQAALSENPSLYDSYIETLSN